MFEIIGHRGASYDAPENTLAAVQLAWEQQADGVEVDIHLTADDHLVVIHDETTKRVAKKDIKIRESNLLEVKAIDVKKTHKIPTLWETIKTVPPTKSLFIEFKCGLEAVIPLRNILQLKNVDFKIISFNIKALKEIRNTLPTSDIYWLQNVDDLDDYLVNWLIEKCAVEKFQGLVLGSYGVNQKLVELLHKANLKLYSWTVNSPSIANRFKEWGVDGIITDRPGWIRDKLFTPIWG